MGGLNGYLLLCGALCLAVRYGEVNAVGSFLSIGVSRIYRVRSLAVTEVPGVGQLVAVSVLGLVVEGCLEGALAYRERSLRSSVGVRYGYGLLGSCGEALRISRGESYLVVALLGIYMLRRSLSGGLAVTEIP